MRLSTLASFLNASLFTHLVSDSLILEVFALEATLTVLSISAVNLRNVTYWV